MCDARRCGHAQYIPGPDRRPTGPGEITSPDPKRPEAPVQHSRRPGGKRRP